jgi:hypothetical protein
MHCSREKKTHVPIHDIVTSLMFNHVVCTLIIGDKHRIESKLPNSIKFKVHNYFWILIQNLLRSSPSANNESCSKSSNLSLGKILIFSNTSSYFSGLFLILCYWKMYKEIQNLISIALWAISVNLTQSVTIYPHPCGPPISPPSSLSLRPTCQGVDRPNPQSSPHASTMRACRSHPEATATKATADQVLSACLRLWPHTPLEAGQPLLVWDRSAHRVARHHWPVSPVCPASPLDSRVSTRPSRPALSSMPRQRARN